MNHNYYMDFSCLFGHDVYIDNSRVGYVAKSHGDGATIFFGGSKLGRLYQNGDIEIKEMKIGHIEESGDIFIQSRKVGKVNDHYDLLFNLKDLTKAIEGDY